MKTRKKRNKPAGLTSIRNRRTTATRPNQPSQTAKIRVVPARTGSVREAKERAPTPAMISHKAAVPADRAGEEDDPNQAGRERELVPFDELMPVVNGAIVGSVRVIKFLTKSVLCAGGKLAAMRGLVADEAAWVREVQQRFGLSASEAYFFVHFERKYRSLRQRLEPFVAIRLSELLELIARSFDFSSTDQGGVCAHDVRFVPRPQTWRSDLHSRDDLDVNARGTESPPKRPKSSSKAAAPKKTCK
jgi:hypothetical protein